MSGEVQREALRNELARVTAERDKYLAEANRRGKVLGEARDEFLKHDGDRVRYRAALTRIAADPYAGESAMIAREALKGDAS